MPAKYGVEGDLRQALYSAADEFVGAVGLARPFMGGAQPDLSDLSAYGVLKALERTPTFKDLMANSRISEWYARVDARVGPSARTATEGSTWGVAPPMTKIVPMPPTGSK